MKEIRQRNDVGSIQEALRRRFTAYEENREGFKTLPDLILVDGGAGQVAAAETVLQEKGIRIPVYGMVKDDKHRTRSLVGCIRRAQASGDRKQRRLQGACAPGSY